MTKKGIIRVLKWFSGITLGIFLLITLLIYIFRDDICQMAITELNRHLKVKVSVSEVDLSFWSTFPNMSVDFNHVFIQDSYENSDERDTLLFSQRLRFKFDPWELWEENYTIKSIEVEPGVIMLKVNDKGQVNYDIFKPGADTTEEQVDLHLKEIVIRDFRFKYLNEVSGQDHSTKINSMVLNGDMSKKVFTAKASSELHIIESRSQKLRLVSDKSAVLDVEIRVNTDSGTVRIPDSQIKIEDLPFRFEGSVDSSSYEFSLKGDKILIRDAANKLALEETEKVRKFSGSGELLFDLMVRGELQSDEPASVECNFGVTNGNLREPETGVMLNSIRVDGFYSNRGGAAKEELNLRELSFRTKAGVFNGKLHISEFANPLYRGSADGTVNLAVFHSLFKLPYLDKVSGNADLRTDFRIKSKPLENGSTDLTIEKLEGQLQMHNVDARIREDRRQYQKLNGKVYLRNDQVGLEKVSLYVGGSDVTINGIFASLSDYLSHKGSLNANVEVRSKLTDLRDLATEEKQDKVEQERSFILPDNISGEVYLRIDDLRHEGHSFKEVAGNMVIGNRMIHFPRLALETGGADVAGSLTIEERRPEIFYLDVQAVSQNIELDKLFREWNNFSQEVIKSENISGRAKANIRLEAPFDYRLGVVPNAIRAQVGLKVENGRLKNVRAFNEITQSMHNTASARMLMGKENIEIFGRKLNDLKFEELSNTLFIENSMITIPSMSIRSSALEMETTGKHGFDNKIDYRFGFRFRDLKKKESSEFGEIMDDGSGIHVFMRMYGDLDNPNFEWDSEANRQKRKQQIDQEKETVKSILKSEFGLYSNDTTVKRYIEDKGQHETLELIVDPVEQIDTLFDQKKPRKDTRLNRYLENLKKEAESEKKEEFVIDD